MMADGRRASEAMRASWRRLSWPCDRWTGEVIADLDDLRAAAAGVSAGEAGSDAVVAKRCGLHTARPWMVEPRQAMEMPAERTAALL
jgi:hypothetical protein